MDKKREIYLVKKARKKNGDAFCELTKSYEKILYNSAYKILLNNDDVLDCLLDTQISAWLNIKKLKDNSAFKSWIFKIMINKANDILRKNKKIIDFKKNGFESISEPSYSIEMYEQISKLSELYRIPIVLYYYSGFSITEIADLTNTSSNTVKTRLARARGKLKIQMEDDSYER